MSHPLIITSERKASIQKFLEVANREDHWFYPGKSDWVPGDRAEHIFQLESYRVVYTCSVVEGKPHRHITIGIPGTKLPDPIAVFTIAKLFGFTGGKWAADPDIITECGKDWKIGTAPIGEGRECLMVIQEIEQRNSSMQDTFEKLYGPSSED